MLAQFKCNSSDFRSKKKNRSHIGVGRTDRNNDGNDLNKKTFGSLALIPSFKNKLKIASASSREQNHCVSLRTYVRVLCECKFAEIGLQQRECVLCV